MVYQSELIFGVGDAGAKAKMEAKSSEVLGGGRVEAIICMLNYPCGRNEVRVSCFVRSISCVNVENRSRGDRRASSIALVSDCSRNGNDQDRPGATPLSTLGPSNSLSSAYSAS